MSAEVDIKSNMLTWAIALAGYELDELIPKLPKVQEWIDEKEH